MQLRTWLGLSAAFCLPLQAEALDVDVVVEVPAGASTPLSGARVVLEREVGALTITEAVGDLVDGRCRLTADSAGAARRWARIEATSSTLRVVEADALGVQAPLLLGRAEVLGGVARVPLSPLLLPFCAASTGLKPGLDGPIVVAASLADPEARECFAGELVDFVAALAGGVRERPKNVNRWPCTQCPSSAAEGSSYTFTKGSGGVADPGPGTGSAGSASEPEPKKKKKSRATGKWVFTKGKG